MRGEKFLNKVLYLPNGGSPPHTRGKDPSPPVPPLSGRITPACAGKRAGVCKRNHRHEDHPRMRGEKRCMSPALIRAIGSPPHARGKEHVVVIGGGGSRITPACAGKSRSPPAIWPCRWDHPRMRGEKAMVEELCHAIWGSPPHARGKASALSLPPFCGRITPACAGKRSTAKKADALWGDHPRMRGEKGIAFFASRL